SPAEVLERCRFEMTARGHRHKLTPRRRAAIERQNEEMADRALRVLGFAYRETEARPSSGSDLPIEDLTWVGLAGMADPVRPGVNALMRKLHCSGIQTIMLTGDQSATARAVAAPIGLDGRGQIDGIDGGPLEAMPAA